MSGTSIRLRPELAWADGRFRRGITVEIDAQAGTITAVGAAGGGDAVELPGRALLPGMVNAHSHAFQRLIRGHTQWKPADRPHADFWSWREAMYAALARLTVEQVYAVSRFAFIEMLLAGYTTVGEFHYLQRDPDGAPYADPNELAHAVLRGARDAGIRIALLNVCYAEGGIGQPLQPGQRRFATPDLDAFLTATDELRNEVAGSPAATVGVAPHSVRAVRRDWLPPIAEFARQRALPLHMHLSEQPAEVDACVAAHGVRPVELAAQIGLLAADFTAIHATHIADNEVALLAGSGATICLCPTTERDLGDGIARADALLDAGAHLAIGTDSQTVIDPWEELRCIEYHLRLKRLERVVLARSDHDRLEVGAPLLTIGGTGGARSLRINAGTIAAGRAADLIAIDLEHHALAGWTDSSLPALLTLSAPPGVVSDVWVGGEQIVRDRWHRGLEEARTGFSQASRRVFCE